MPSIPLYLSLLRYSMVHVTQSPRNSFLRYYISLGWIIQITLVIVVSLPSPKTSCGEVTLNFSIIEFAKCPRILNMVMTFILTPWSHYNTITEPHAHFLLSLMKGLSIDFPSHMIESIIDCYRRGPQLISELGLVVRLIASFSVMLKSFPFHSFEFQLYQVMMPKPMSDHLRQKQMHLSFSFCVTYPNRSSICYPKSYSGNYQQLQIGSIIGG